MNLHPINHFLSPTLSIPSSMTFSLQPCSQPSCSLVATSFSHRLFLSSTSFSHIVVFLFPLKCPYLYLHLYTFLCTTSFSTLPLQDLYRQHLYHQHSSSARLESCPGSMKVLKGLAKDSDWIVCWYIFFTRLCFGSII